MVYMRLQINQAAMLRLYKEAWVHPSVRRERRQLAYAIIEGSRARRITADAASPKAPSQPVDRGLKGAAPAGRGGGWLLNPKGLSSWLVTHHASFTPEEVASICASCASSTSAQPWPAMTEECLGDEARVTSNLSILRRWVALACRAPINTPALNPIAPHSHPPLQSLRHR